MEFLKFQKKQSEFSSCFFCSFLYLNEYTLCINILEGKMNRRYSRNKRSIGKVREVLYTHIENNLKEYIIVTLIFFIGIIIGVIFINNITDEQSSEIINYITMFIQDLKENIQINELALLKNTIKNNCILGIVLWFMGSTVIGISIVYIIICFRGFCLGYTISSIIYSIGLRKRIIIHIFQFIITKHTIYTCNTCSCS